MIQKIKRFFGEARQEFRHVNWPAPKEAVRLTAIVVALSLALALFLGGFDYLFSFGIRSLVSGFSL